MVPLAEVWAKVFLFYLDSPKSDNFKIYLFFTYFTFLTKIFSGLISKWLIFIIFKLYNTLIINYNIEKIIYKFKVVFLIY